MYSVREVVVKILSFKYKNMGYADVTAEDMVSRRLSEFRNRSYPAKVRKIAKRHGFLPSTVLALGITEDNYQDYLSDTDYYKMGPLNGDYHPWVNNKITLKYLLGDLASYMPKYFYEIQEGGSILKLFECPAECDASVAGITKLLQSERSLAIKRLKGFGGAGFYKVFYDEKNDLYVNDVKYTQEEFEKFLGGLSNYLILEYLESAGLPAQIYPKTANSIRVIIGKEDGKQYHISNFIKFGNQESGYVDNLTGGGISCPIDENGEFIFGYTKVKGVMVEVDEHPDTHAKLVGKLKEWDEIQEMAQKVMERLPQLTYCGFDFVVSDKGVKILEINDMSGFLTTQKYTPLLKNKEDNFYLKRLAKLNF